VPFDGCPFTFAPTRTGCDSPHLHPDTHRPLAQSTVLTFDPGCCSVITRDTNPWATDRLAWTLNLDRTPITLNPAACLWDAVGRPDPGRLQEHVGMRLQLPPVSCEHKSFHDVVPDKALLDTDTRLTSPPVRAFLTKRGYGCLFSLGGYR